MATSSASPDGVLPSGVRPLRADDPSRISGHRLLGRLGAGGMGVVYLGEDPLGGFVAVKAAHADPTGDDEPRRRLAAEAECVGRVPDAFTARLLADGTARTPAYMVTEYIEGRSLADVVRNDGPLPPEQLHAFAVGVGRALAAVHAAGVVHRDLKPANVLLTPTGPRLIDFGIAHDVSAAGGATRPGMVVGSPGWIAPERLDRRPATPASDVFGWGCLVAYAATGRNPFGDGDRDELVRRVMLDPPDLEGLDEPLRALVAQALAKDPAARPAAEDLLEPLPRRDTRELPTFRPRRQWVLAPAAAVLVAGAVVVGIMTSGGGGDVTPLPPGGVASTKPPAGSQAATHRVPVPRPHDAHSTTPRPPAASPSVVMPAPATAPAPGKPKKQKGKAKGKGGGGPGKKNG
jgi:serine/threonine protein kinase